MERQAERGAGGAGRAGGAVRDGARLVRLHALHELLPAGPQLRPRVWGRARECVHQSQSKSYSNLSSLSTVGMLCVYLTAPSCQNTRTAMHMHAALSLHARPPGVRRLSQARLGTRKLAMALELLAALERALAQRQGEGLGILAPFSLRPGKSPSQYSMYYLRFEDLAKTLAFGVFITKTKHKN